MSCGWLLKLRLERHELIEPRGGSGPSGGAMLKALGIEAGGPGSNPGGAHSAGVTRQVDGLAMPVEDGLKTFSPSGSSAGRLRHELNL